MYTKVYRITSDAEHRDGLLDYYDTVITPAIEASDRHVGHVMVDVGDGAFILSSHYTSADAASAAVPMVQELVGPMRERFGMTLDVIGEGEAVRRI
jgi:hypothetical protein